MLLQQYNPVTASMEIAKLMEISEEVTVAVGEKVATRAAIKVMVDIKTRVGIRGNSRTAKNRFCRRCSIKAAISRFDRDIPRTSTKSRNGVFHEMERFGVLAGLYILQSTRSKGATWVVGISASGV